MLLFECYFKYVAFTGVHKHILTSFVKSILFTNYLNIYKRLVYLTHNMIGIVERPTVQFIANIGEKMLKIDKLLFLRMQ